MTERDTTYAAQNISQGLLDEFILREGAPVSQLSELLKANADNRPLIDRASRVIGRGPTATRKSMSRFRDVISETSLRGSNSPWSLPIRVAQVAVFTGERVTAELVDREDPLPEDTDEYLLGRIQDFAIQGLDRLAHEVKLSDDRLSILPDDKEVPNGPLQQAADKLCLTKGGLQKSMRPMLEIAKGKTIGEDKNRRYFGAIYDIAGIASVFDLELQLGFTTFEPNAQEVTSQV